MSHPGAVSRHRCGLLLVIAAGLAPALAVSTDQSAVEAEDQSSYYTYHDDWAIVSAPPPPGPYQSVNIDPRIPGQEDVLPALVGAFNAPPTANEPPANEPLPEDYMSAPPAAGIPSPEGAASYPGRGSFDYGPPPGYYRPRGFGMRRSTPVREYGRSYYGYPQSGESRYRYAPAPWGDAPIQRTEDEVPPPAVYNRMVAPAPPGYRSGPAPDQGYRRGTGTQ